MRFWDGAKKTGDWMRDEASQRTWFAKAGWVGNLEGTNRLVHDTGRGVDVNGRRVRKFFAEGNGGDFGGPGWRDDGVYVA